MMLEYITDFAIVYLTYNAILGIIFVKRNATKNMKEQTLFEILVFALFVTVALPFILIKDIDNNGQT